MQKMALMALPTAMAMSLGALSFGAPHPAAAEEQTGSHGWSSYPDRAPRAQLGQERATRATEAPDLRPSAPKLRTARASDKSTVPVRMTQNDRPDGTRSPATASPHATDPNTPRPSLSRSAQENLRAPLLSAGPDGRTAMTVPHRAKPARAPRMDAAADTRTSRASFEDWLFGR